MRYLLALLIALFMALGCVVEPPETVVTKNYKLITKDMPQCGPHERWCQTGPNDYTCVDADEDCPNDFRSGARMPNCDAGERLCQTGSNDYTCVDVDEDCPDGDDDEHEIPDCDWNERLCQTGPDDYTCVDADESCP